MTKRLPRSIGHIRVEHDQLGLVRPREAAAAPGADRDPQARTALHAAQGRTRDHARATRRAGTRRRAVGQRRLAPDPRIPATRGDVGRRCGRHGGDTGGTWLASERPCGHWVLLSRPNWRRAVQIVTPDTVVRWHRRGFALYWGWKSRPRRTGRPAVAVDIRAPIRQMHAANPLWGASRIHGESRKLGLQVSQTTVAKYLGRRNGSPSPTWRTCLTHHVSQLASIDFFTVSTATFRVLFVVVVLAHD